MAKLIKVMPTLAFVADKISAVDINNENKKQVRVFIPGIVSGYILNCDSEETARELYDNIVNEL